MDYIIIDLPEGETQVEVPIDEPFTAWSRENFVRLYAPMHVDGRLVRPRQGKIRVVPVWWARKALVAWESVPEIT